MGNQYVNGSLGDLVRVQGEQLARLTIIVEQDHIDLVELRKSTDLIAKVVAEREAKEIVRSDIKTKVFGVAIPLLCTFVGAFAGHFLPH